MSDEVNSKSLLMSVLEYPQNDNMSMSSEGGEEVHVMEKGDEISVSSSKSSLKADANKDKYSLDSDDGGGKPPARLTTPKKNHVKLLPTKRRTSPKRAAKTKAEERAKVAAAREKGLSNKNKKKRTQKNLPATDDETGVAITMASMGNSGIIDRRVGNLVKKAPNFTPEEDIALARAWRSASEDPIMGSCMKAATFQSEIKKKFYRIVGETDDENKRDGKALLIRFQRFISPACMRILALYQREVKKNESGKNEDDWVQQALENYSVEIGGKKGPKPIREGLEECFLLLRECPKFNVTLPSSTGKSEGGANSHNTTTIAMAGSIQRPTGSKKAKIMKKVESVRGDAAKSINDLGALFATMNEDNLLLKKREEITSRAKFWYELGEKEKAKEIMREHEKMDAEVRVAALAAKQKLTKEKSVQEEKCAQEETGDVNDDNLDLEMSVREETGDVDDDILELGYRVNPDDTPDTPDVRGRQSRVHCSDSEESINISSV